MFDDRRNAKYCVGQMVRFYYTAGASKETLVSYCWSGKIIESLQETEGIFYRVELDEQAKQIVGYSYLELF